MYTTLHLQIAANSKNNAIVGMVNNRLKVKIQAPAIEGKVNKELIKFLAQEFSIPKSEIEILSGETSKFKKVKILTNEHLKAFLSQNVET